MEPGEVVDFIMTGDKVVLAIFHEDLVNEEAVRLAQDLLDKKLADRHFGVLTSHESLNRMYRCPICSRILRVYYKGELPDRVAHLYNNRSGAAGTGMVPTMWFEEEEG